MNYLRLRVPKNIVSRPKAKSMDIKMPERVGINGGTGYLKGGGGLNGVGFFDLELNLFGGDKGAGNELEGTFFDLKMKPDGSPAKMDEHSYNEVIRKFLESECI